MRRADGIRWPLVDELLPVIVAKLPDADARTWLGAVALAHEVALLPLADAPIDGSMHFLEVYTPGIDEPLVLLAEPQGAPNEIGMFPLRLRPMNEAQERTLRKARDSTGDYGDDRTLVQPPRSMREAYASDAGSANGDRISSTATLSAGHTADLSRSEPPPRNEIDGDALAGRTLAGGKYTILELLGSGGAGRVYKARHRELQKIVAVKVLHPSFQRDLDFCARFYGEALAASKLDHPNVLRILDFGQEPDGMLFIAMEFLAGRNLQAVIDEGGPQRLERIVDVMMQTCAALSIAHEQGVVHRDIKPENIVLVPGRDDDGRPIETVKVCDFGIAQRRTGGTRDATLIQTEKQRVVSGTPQYMSPEQGRGEDLDERSDIYSCGVVLYELTTGRVPFEAEQPMLILRQHFMDPPRPPSQLVPDVDPLLEVTILKALRKDPSERQQTARELAPSCASSRSR
jgi:predicted Ser/Thr protein kinase